MCSLFSIDFAVACSLELCTFQDLFGQPSLDFDDTFINVTQYLLFPLDLMSSPHITVFFHSQWSGEHITCPNISMSVGWYQVSDIFDIKYVYTI